MMEITEKFKRLPPLAGVHFAGFKDVKIESRQSVVRQLRDFMRYCLKEATSPAVQVILGEWGEGKTEAYQRYIQPEIKAPNCAYLVSASTIAQSLPKVQAQSPLASLNFLAAVFYAIQHEAKADQVPPFERFMDTEQWLEAILQAYAKGRIFVFIDEFEELILDPPALRAILSGLKELINKQYRPVTEEGPYPGIISFFLSCTPDAYARMQRDPAIAEVFGSWERRADKIQLMPVTKREGVKFLYDLMCYAYDSHLPVPLPIKDLGVFYTLQTIGRGNLGALVTLFTKVFNGSTIDDKTMGVIDGTKVLDILAGETISVYGGTARCVERHLLESFAETLDEQEIRLLRLLAGELRPFSTAELAARLAIHDPAEVSALIARINQKLVSAGKANNAVASFVPLREGLSFEDVRSALEPEIRENEIQVDGFTQHLDELEDNITFLELREGKMFPRVFFPWDHRMISATFEGITPDSARRLEKRVEKIIDQSEFHYRLSNELIFQLFPTPIPFGLEFIKDRDLRLKMWRDTTARFPQLFRDDASRAFLSLIQYAETFDIEAHNLQTVRDGLAATIKDTAQNAIIRCYCYAQYGDLGPEAVRRIEEGLRETEGAHLAITVHIGEVTEQGREEIRAREMEDRLLLIPLHTSLAKRLLITYQAKTSHTQSIDDKLFVDSVTRLFKSEIELSRRVKEWLERGVQAGIVLKDLYKATARSERDLADSLKFYINRLGEPDTPENIFQANDRLMGFVPFGSRAGFIPDVESAAQLRKYTEDLAKNGFVRWDRDGTVHVISTPPEKRLLYILERAETVAKSDVRGHFINCAQARNILEDVYLNILKHKGLIEESKGLLALARREKALQEMESVRATYQELLTARSQQEEWPAFAHVFVTKQRDSRFIAIADLEAYLDDLYEAIHRAAQQGREEVVLQRAALLKTLAEHLQNVLMPKVDSAISEARRVREDILSQIDSLLEDIEDIVNQYNKWLKQNAALDNVREAKELKEGKDRLREICRTPIRASDLGEEEERDGAFAHQGWSGPDQHFNIALRRLRKSAESLQQQESQYKKVLEEIYKALRELEDIGRGTRSQLLTIQLAEGYKLSKVIHTRLEAFLRGMSTTDSAFAPQPIGGIAPALSLRKMCEDLREYHRPLKERYGKAERAINALKKLLETESGFHDAAKRCLDVYQVLADKADVEPFKTRLQRLADNREQILGNYYQQAPELDESEDEEVTDPVTISKVSEETERLVARLQELTSALEQVWNEYVKECEHFLGSIDRMIQLVKRRDPSLRTDSIEVRCKVLLSSLKGKQWPEKPMSHYETMKAEIRKETMRLLEKTLNETEGSILVAVVDRREQSQNGWFSLSQIAREIAEEMALSNAEVENLLRSLVRKGYLTEGIAIPVF
jgi:hypothetical protein